MKRIEKDFELTQQVITSLDEVLSSSAWEDSLFFKTRAKRLRQLRDEGKAILGSLIPKNTAMKVIQYSPCKEMVMIY